MSTPALLDAIIIGGGPGGLAAANALGRQFFNVVVFDSGVYRNARASHMHNVLGWDHTPPSVFRAKAKQNIIDRYRTIQFENIGIKAIRKTDKGFFEATDDTDKVWTGRKVVLATGAHDIFPDIPGYADCWGYSIFACLFCHGFEEAQAGAASAGVLVTPGPFADHMVHISHQARRLVKDKRITMYTNGDDQLTAKVTQQLGNDKDARAGLITVDDRKITKLELGPKHGEIVLTFEDGTTKLEGFLSHIPPAKPNGPFVEQLGLELGGAGEIKVNPPFNETTSVPGVFAVGDAANLMRAVATAQFMGAAVGGGISMQIGQELAAEE